MITRVNGTKVTSADQLRSLVDAHRPGDEISVTYVRNGTAKTIHVKLAARPS